MRSTKVVRLTPTNAEATIRVAALEGAIRTALKLLDRESLYGRAGKAIETLHNALEGK